MPTLVQHEMHPDLPKDSSTLLPMEQRANLLRAYNERLSSVYDEATRKNDSSWTPPREVLQRVLPYVRPGTRVLDLGIGTGQSSGALADAGADITGIDISGAMLAVAARKHPLWKLYEADIESFPILEGLFDIAVASGVLEFVSDVKSVFKKVHALLNDDGTFCFTYEEYLPGHPLQEYREAELGKGISDPIPETLSFLVYRRSLEEMQKLLVDMGFAFKTAYRFAAYYKLDGAQPVVYQVVLAKK